MLLFIIFNCIRCFVVCWYEILIREYWVILRRRNRILDEDVFIEKGRNIRDFRGSREGILESLVGKKMNLAW